MTTLAKRIDKLYDTGSFEELYPELIAGYIVGRGLINGRTVCLCASNTERPKWSPLATLRKENLFLEYLQEHPAPVVFMMDAPNFSSTSSGGSPVPPDADELQVGHHCVGRTYYLQARLQQLMPMIGVLCGQVGAALSFPVTLCDVAVMVDGSAMCIGRPDAVRLMVGENVTYDELGGAVKHCTVTGQGHVLAPTDEDALRWVRRYLSFLPERAGGPLPSAPAVEPAVGSVPLEQIVPKDCLKPFKMHGLVEAVIDNGSLLEIKELYARPAITALARVEGHVCGIVANDPSHFGGILFPDVCRKMTEFIRFCDAFGIPLVFLADTPGFMVGRQTEDAGSIKAGSDLFAAIARCRTARLCIVVRKAYTAGLYAMGGAGFSPDRLLALPTASIAVYGRKALELLVAQGNLTEDGVRSVAEMLKGVEDPWRLQEKGMIDRVIDWSEIRSEIASFLNGRSRQKEAAHACGAADDA